MGSQQQFCLRWKNHQLNLLNVFDQLLQNESFVDVTLACDGHSLKAHKVVLSACSPYFQKLFLENPCQHPIVILKDVSYEDLKAAVDFMYKGEVNVLQDQLQQLLRTAEVLKIKGLSEVSSAASTSVSSTATTTTTTTPLSTAYGVCSLAKRNRDSGSGNGGIAAEMTPTVLSTSPPPVPPASNCRPDNLGVVSLASPTNKRKNKRPRRKSDSMSDPEEGGLEMEGPPEVIETKVDILHDTLSVDGMPHPATELIHCNEKFALPVTIPKEEEEDEEEHPVNHLGSSKVVDEASGHPSNGDMQSTSLDPQMLLEISGYSDSSTHQFNSSLPPHLSDAVVADDANKSNALRRMEFSVTTCTASTTSASAAAATNIYSDVTVTMAPSSEHCEADQRPDLNSGSVVPVLQPGQWASNGEVNHHTLEAFRPARPSSSDPSIPGKPAAASKHGGQGASLLLGKRDLSVVSNWTEDDLHQALDAIKTGRLSIMRAAVTYGIPNTTLWQRTRREGIEGPLSRSGGGSFNHSWTQSSLTQALDAIRLGRMSVNKASSTYGIPSTTLWSRARRYGIETGRRSAWEQERDEVMWQALQAVRGGSMSMTQASIKYNIPYTTLWKHFKKWENSSGSSVPVSTPPAVSSSTSTAAAPMSLNMTLPLSMPVSLPPSQPPPHHHHHHHLPHHQHHHHHHHHSLPSPLAPSSHPSPSPPHSMILAPHVSGMHLQPHSPLVTQHSQIHHPIENIVSDNSGTASLPS